MDKLFILIFLFLNPLFIFSQSGYWEYTNGPHSGTINDYSFSGNNIVYAAADNGVYKSTDGGESWFHLGISGVEIWGICKTSSGALLAGIYGNGINRTTDEGQTWVQTTTYSSYIYDIKQINPDLILFATPNGVFKSTNDGLSWNSILSAAFATSIDVSSDGIIYVSAADAGIYRSSNNGSNWSKIPNSHLGNAFSVNVANNGYLFVTTWNGSIYRSTNDGLTFEDLSSKNRIYKTYMSVTTNDGYLYTGTFYQGIWSSSDYVDTWTKQYLGERTNFFVRKLCEGPNGKVFASVNGNGCIQTTNHGAHWNGYRFRDSHRPTYFMLRANDGSILSSTSQTSTDNGMNWVYSDYDFLPSSFAINKENGYLFASDNSAMDIPLEGIYRSTNNGIDWEFIFIKNFGPGAHVYVSGNGDVYAISYYTGVFKSTNNGLNWSHITSTRFTALAANQNFIFGKTNTEIYRSSDNGNIWNLILSLPSYFGVIFNASNGDIYTDGNGTLYMSSNNGDDWTDMEISGNSTSIIENESGRIFISVLGSGVYMRSGDEWINISYDLGNYEVNSLCFNDAGQLLAGTNAGVYRTYSSIISVNNFDQNIPNNFILHQNYPNPFNPRTVIPFSLKKSAYVKLIAYDIRGVEIQKLADGKYSAGEYEVDFMGKFSSSGVYFYKIEVTPDNSGERFIDTKRMMLLK